MTEAFLHYLFDSRKLGSSFQTVDGRPIEILDFGQLNTTSGPDFLFAQIRYDDKRWAGHIEFHLTSSDWFKHGHQRDEAYNNVIAHFVLQDDQPVKIGSFEIPTVELKNEVSNDSFWKYQKQLKKKGWIPCASLLQQVNKDIIRKQLGLAVAQRLERKSIEVMEWLKKTQGDIQKVLMVFLARSLGGKVNKQGFTTLIEKVDINVLDYLNYEPLKIQSLLHGLSGLLPANSKDPYVQCLIREFNYQRQFFQLQPMAKTEWHFSAFRPAGHPSFRIAQLAQLLSQKDFSEALKQPATWLANQMKHALPDYWSTHYHFDVVIKQKSNFISESVINGIAINAVAPVLYAQSVLKGNPAFKMHAMQLLQQLKPEDNHIIRHWKKLGIEAHSAFDSQALIEMKNEYCNQKKCLFCKIGRTVLKT